MEAVSLIRTDELQRTDMRVIGIAECYWPFVDTRTKIVYQALVHYHRPNRKLVHVETVVSEA